MLGTPGRMVADATRSRRARNTLLRATPWRPNLLRFDILAECYQFKIPAKERGT